METEKIEVGFEVFVADGQKPIGTVRQISHHRPVELVIYFENAGDRRIPIEAVAAVHSEKVILDLKKLDPGTREAIRHLHDVEDPRI
ncbi:MAG: hypothetical protein WBP94_11560 [Rhodomicrobiaceae bacterium]